MKRGYDDDMLGADLLQKETVHLCRLGDQDCTVSVCYIKLRVIVLLSRVE